jgi:hypothetical protein
MPALLTLDSTMTCPHGGTITGTPGANHASAGSLILRGSDTFEIVGCPFNIAGAPSPCLSVTWLQTASHVKHGGELVLDESSVGMCSSGAQAPQGAVLIVSTQPSAGGS